MSEFNYKPPAKYRSSVLSGSIQSNNSQVENYRIKSFLLLLGIGKISDSNNSFRTLSKTFFTIPFARSAPLNRSNILSYFPQINSNEFERFFKNSLSKNSQFHKNIYSEILTAIGYYEKNNPIAMFLHIYRLIEQTALCLPIVSIIEKANYQFTFNEIKELVDGSAKSDLSVLKKYSEIHLESSRANVNITLNFSSTRKPDENVRLLESFIPQKKRDQIIVSSNNTSIEIKMKHFHIFIISFRNQYFHYLFHEKNINFDRLTYPEDLLNVCNPYFMNYFAQLFFDLLSSEISMWA